MRKLKKDQRCVFRVLIIVTLVIVGLVFQILGIVDQRIWSVVVHPWVSPVSTNENRELEKPCQPKTHVMFLKTHKTASSTILNILYRFGEAKNLTFALPASYQFGYPHLFNTRMIKSYRPNNTREYHIICNHMRFYQPQVEKAMPNGTFYISILRNPVTLAESSFAYYKGSSKAFEKVGSLEEFLSEPWKYYSATASGSQYARNLMWFDFGYDHNANESEEYVEFVLNKISSTFHLILISEYFDESMILLKDTLCWEFDDVVSFKLNSRSNVTVKTLFDQAADQVKAWNSLDWRLYSHFNKTFWQKVDQYGHHRMKDDILVLREARRKLMGLCLQGNSPIDASQIQDKKLKPFQYGRAQIMGYNLNSNLDNRTREKCLRMVMPELQYKDLLDAKFLLSAPSGKILQTPPSHV